MSGSVGPGGGITAKVCDFGLASSSYRTTASHHFGQLWWLLYTQTNNQVNQANKPVYIYYKIANVQHKQHGNEQNSVYTREQHGSWDIQSCIWLNSFMLLRRIWVLRCGHIQTADPLLPNETCRRTGIMLVTILKEASHEIMWHADKYCHECELAIG
jgi:hypothetical protein